MKRLKSVSRRIETRAQIVLVRNFRIAQCTSPFREGGELVEKKKKNGMQKLKKMVDGM